MRVLQKNELAAVSGGTVGTDDDGYGDVGGCFDLSYGGDPYIVCFNDLSSTLVVQDGFGDAFTVQSLNDGELFEMTYGGSSVQVYAQYDSWGDFQSFGTSEGGSTFLNSYLDPAAYGPG